MNYPLRTRFAKDIVAEFLMPAKWSNKVIIICGGMPGMPHSGKLDRFLVRKGYWVIRPRYRGTWESGGKFLAVSPHLDIRAIMDQLPRGFKDLFNGKIYRVKVPEVYLIGASFGGPAALLNSRDLRVKKVIVIAPVVDWRAASKTEPIHKAARFVHEAFGGAYRMAPRGWEKLKSGKFYNPAAALGEVDGSKVLILHAKDDDVVDARSVARFAKTAGTELIMRPHGGHLSSTIIMHPAIWKKVRSFVTINRSGKSRALDRVDYYGI
jgi:esterase/lipase